jgi:3-hydroxybutyryl-CoA dehydrogenase
MSNNPYPTIAVAGSGAIATGLAALASRDSRKVLVLTRSAGSAAKATKAIERSAARIDGADPARVVVTTEPAELADAGLIVEAIVEDLNAKAEILGRLGRVAPGADLSTTTSSLSIAGLAESCGHPERLFGLHVFNPVPVMNLVELCLPPSADPAIGDRARAWCESLGKTPVFVPDTPGFVVNRLLFPYLFDAARFQEKTGMPAADVDTCMTLGVAHPMGPLALLDLVGLDVAVAIGEALHAESGDENHLAPEPVRRLVEAGRLGRKTGAGFYEYG